MMTAPPRTLVAIATYNEVENLPRLVDEVFVRVSHARILVVDDNSPDGTGRWCDARALHDDRFQVLHRPTKQGLGTAVLQAMRHAEQLGFELLVTMDADFSHAPRYIPDLIAGMDPATAPPVDVMIGSRYVPGGGVEGWPWQRRWMSRLVNFYARHWLKLAPRDCSGGFRCYRVAVLRRVDLERMRSRGYSFLEELLWRLQRAGALVAETPIVFVNRRHGHSKIDLREAWSALWILFRLGWSPP